MKASSQTQQIDPQEINDASPPILMVTDGTAIKHYNTYRGRRGLGGSCVAYPFILIQDKSRRG
jgi:hypothetical protein